jgi:hypothetical protein
MKVVKLDQGGNATIKVHRNRDYTFKFFRYGSVTATGSGLSASVCVVAVTLPITQDSTNVVARWSENTCGVTATESAGEGDWKLVENLRLREITQPFAESGAWCKAKANL